MHIKKAGVVQDKWMESCVLGCCEAGRGCETESDALSSLKCTDFTPPLLGPPMSILLDDSMPLQLTEA
jgi:hypothetical protein